MTLLNEGAWDRAVRVIFGAGLAYAGWSGVVSAGWPSWVLTIAGGMLLVTGFVGWCPAYTLIRFDSKRPGASQCRRPKTE